MRSITKRAIPVATYLEAHFDLKSSRPLQTQAATFLVAGGLLFSAKTVFAWGKRAFRDGWKAAGFVVLLEGVMITSNVPVLPLVLLVRLEDASGPEYSGAFMGITIRFTTEGPLRGRCGHQHKNIESAVKCLDEDEAWCRERGGGGHSDRRILVVGAGKKRELNDSERTAVDAYRAGPR